jgi:predicted transposase YbfD/YdcC
MDAPEYSTLREALGGVADPRKAKGQRYEWVLLLTVVCMALASGHKSVRAIAQWATEHKHELLIKLQPQCQQMPSASTLYRALRQVGVCGLEAQLAILAGAVEAAVQHRATSKGELVGQAIDGKEVRGARAHGHPLCLVSLVRHTSGVVLEQQAVADKSNEIMAVPYLLQGKDLTGTVTTMDALLTQRSIAAQIRQTGGHYVMVVKQNHPQLCAAIAECFQDPPWLASEQAQCYRVYKHTEKGHGRLETRTMESSWWAAEYARECLGWYSVQQIMKRTCKQVKLSTGELSEAVTYGITSLGWHQADAAQLEKLWRGHWSIENRVHYIRDVSMGEDAGSIRAGSAPHALAAMRNSLLGLMRARGWENMADALRHYGAHVHNAFSLVTCPVHLL